MSCTTLYIIHLYVRGDEAQSQMGCPKLFWEIVFRRGFPKKGRDKCFVTTFLSSSPFHLHNVLFDCALPTPTRAVYGMASSHGQQVAPSSRSDGATNQPHLQGNLVSSSSHGVTTVFTAHVRHSCGHASPVLLATSRRNQLAQQTQLCSSGSQIN